MTGLDKQLLKKTIMQEYITMSQAAELAGVTSVTISNLRKAGVLGYKKRHTQFYVKRADVEKYADKLFEVVEAENSLETYLQQLEIERADAQQAHQKEMAEFQMRCHSLDIKIESLDLFPQRVRSLLSIVRELFKYFSTIDEITPREIEIVETMLNTRSLHDAALNLNVTRECARQAWDRFLRKLSFIERELQSRDEELTRLTKTIQCLKVENANLERGILMKQNMSEEKKERLYDFLSTRLIDLDYCLSVRALKCLKCAEIDTLGDLLKYHRADLLKFRNFGKKSLHEIDEMLEHYGLSFGMSEEALCNYIVIDSYDCCSSK